jgi:hypothetical protein
MADESSDISWQKIAVFIFVLIGIIVLLIILTMSLLAPTLLE